MTASTSTAFPKSAKSWQETINSLLLREAIHFSYVSNEVHKERFVPKDCFDLLQGKVEEYIKTELPQIKVGADGDTNLNDIVDFILNDALKVFMILVMLRIPDRIVGFHKHNFRDAFLPIQCSRNDSSEPLSIKTFTDNTGSFNSAKEVFVDQEEAWSKGVADIDEFCDLQWSFLAETITSRIYDNDKPWPAKSIIPLVKTFGRKTGGYSEVWKIQLHSAHLDIAQEGQAQAGASSPLFYALKMPRVNEYADEVHTARMFQNEIDVLKVVKGLNHTNIIKVISAFQKGDSPHIICQWAEGGHLRDFWKQRDATSNNIAPVVLWALRELHNLFDALQAVHDHSCRHGDLKPENLLIQMNPQRSTDAHWTEHCRILIADFGLSKVHVQASGARFENTGTGSGEQRYEPPEVIHEGPRSHLYDNWSMACICLEFIIWLLWCNKGVQIFTDLVPHQFWTTVLRTDSPTSRDTVLQSEVSQTMRWLQQNDPRCSPKTALGDLLETTMTKLFMKKQMRAEASVVRNMIEEIYKQASPNTPYLQKSTERPRDLVFLSRKLEIWETF